MDKNFLLDFIFYSFLPIICFFVAKTQLDFYDYKSPKVRKVMAIGCALAGWVFGFLLRRFF